MASVRMIKKDIEYLAEQVLSDCCLSTYFHPEKKKAILSIMQEVVDLRNNLFDRVNHPVEKHNKSLVKKHYAQVRKDLFLNIDELFKKLSDQCK